MKKSKKYFVSISGKLLTIGLRQNEFNVVIGFSREYGKYYRFKGKIMDSIDWFDKEYCSLPF